MTRARRIAIAAAVLGTVASTAAACGGGGADKGGFTSSDRKEAQVALDTLRNTSVATIAIQISATTGLPRTCSVHIERRDPWTFELFMGWAPTNQAETGNTYSWLRVRVDRNGPQQGTWRYGSSARASALRSASGDALTKPYERCQVLGAGGLRGLPVE